MRLPAAPTMGCPPRFRLGTGWEPVRPSGAEPTVLEDPPLDPTDPAVPAEEPLDDPPGPDAGRSLAVPEDDDPGGVARPWALASWGIPRPAATSTAMSI
jgi:hypothetical protein